ncbi:hypothetical protein [Chryseobacterium sp. MMS23-Vi53]|uniref:hypothetical protein n=1 Tax=Chryseobacterium sp. MMS23-Vi53 TaxID=3386644 RepID=UPI0039E77281
MKDPYKLNIDRWQTLNFSLEFWLKGKYIYDTPNFLGNISSYLPGQLLLAVIFYLMGNVGYIQVAAILLFSYAVIKKFKNNFLAVQAIFLLGISLSYIYEAICKSDFISSFIFTASFILLWSEKFKDNYFEKPILLGICLGILCLTRSVVIVALILFLLKSFLKTDWSARIKMTLSFIITIIILLGTVLFPAKSFQYILDHNPLNLQGQSNGFVMLFFLTLTIIMSFYVKKISQVFIYSSIIIFVLMVSFLLEQYFVLGYDYQNNFFSTTYLASCLPFSIVGYCFSIKDEKINKI